MFTPTELSIISDIVRFERELGHCLSDKAFFKSFALDAARRLGLSWNQVMELF